MLPLSGAAQFIASGASIGERPESSASGAYSRLVRPAPNSVPGRKRFHRPSAQAWPLRSSMIGGRAHGLVAAWAWTCSWTVSYTHLRAHETDSYLVCRLLLEK